MPRPIPPLPPLPCGLDGALREPGVFSTRAAQRAGLPAGRLRRGDLQDLGQGLWRVRDRPFARMDLLRALQDLHPRGAFTHGTALGVLGLDLPARLEQDVDVHLALVAGGGGGARRPGVRLHRKIPTMPTRCVEGVRVAEGPWALVDVAAGCLQEEDLVVLGDGMARVAWTEAARRRLAPGVVGLEALRRGVEARHGHRGVRAARAALERVRAGADSPQETRLRLRIVEAGLPEPLVNPQVRLATGQRLRVDLVWAQARVCVEYDGDHHRTDVRQWRADVERDAGLRAEGWTVIRVTADVFRPPGHGALPPAAGGGAGPGGSAGTRPGHPAPSASAPFRSS